MLCKTKSHSKDFKLPVKRETVVRKFLVREDNSYFWVKPLIGHSIQGLRFLRIVKPIIKIINDDMIDTNRLHVLILTMHCLFTCTDMKDSRQHLCL